MERTRSKTISFVNRDSNVKILWQEGKTIGHYPVLVAETLTNRGAIRTANQTAIDNIIMKSDSQVATSSITSKNVIPKQNVIY